MHNRVNFLDINGEKENLTRNLFFLFIIFKKKIQNLHDIKGMKKKGKTKNTIQSTKIMNIIIEH